MEPTGKMARISKTAALVYAKIRIAQLNRIIQETFDFGGSGMPELRHPAGVKKKNGRDLSSLIQR